MYKILRSKEKNKPKRQNLIYTHPTLHSKILYFKKIVWDSHIDI